MTQNYDNHGRDQINIGKVEGNVSIGSGESARRPQAERLLLEEVDRQITPWFTNLLHNHVLINLGKWAQPEQVKRIWDAEVKIGRKPPEPLSSNVSILEVFERSDIAGRLLILGDPGAGKTTTMLELVQALLDKAKQDADYPIPVVIALSGWQESRQSMTDWLADKLWNYGVGKDVAKRLLQEKRLLPLLDSLDEVKPEHQEACVQAINQWLGSDRRPISVVVCSRREEYATSQTQLHLNGAILLQALTEEQIQDYLIRVSRTELWHVLQQDAVLLDLMKTPLLLSITVLSYEALSLQKWQRLTSIQQRLNLLLDTYIQTMLHRDLRDLIMLKRGWLSKSYRNRKPPTAAQTRHWLTFLAQQLQRESQTEFLIERMQPSWLVKAKPKNIHRLLVGLCVGLLYGLFVGLAYGLTRGLLVGLLVGFFGWLSKEIQPVEIFVWSYKLAKKWLIIGLIYGLLIGWFGGLLYGMSVGLFVGLLVVLLFELLLGLIRSEVENKSSPNQGIWKSAINALYIAMIYGLVSGLFSGLLSGLLVWLISRLPVELILELHVWLPVSLPIGLLYGLFAGLLLGGLACIQHFVLRLVLYHERSIPWNYARFLNYCTERLLLQRIGGRYRFVHKLLQERFAELGSGVDG